MKIRSRKIGLVAVQGIVSLTALVWLFPSVARADLIYIPPQDYREECTLENYHYNDMECHLCNVVSDEREDCKEYIENEYEYVCKTEGSPFFEVIYCRDDPGAVGPAGDPDGGDGSCAIVNVSARQQLLPSLLFAGLLLGLGLLLWRRS